MPRPNQREHRFSREATDFFTGLLTICPAELKDAARIVFTTSPWIWEWSNLHDALQIVDVAPIVGNTGTVSPTNEQIGSHLVNQLALAGWSRTQIQTEYQPSRKSRDRLDIVCVDLSSNEVLLAIEVVSPSRFGPETFQQAAKYCNRNGFDRMLVSDGLTHGFVDSNGDFEGVNGLPTPDGGINAIAPARSIACTSIEQLDKLLSNDSPIAVLVDPTIPWMGRSAWRQHDRSPDLTTMEQRLEPDFQSGQLVDLFIAYLMRSRSVELINAILPTEFSTSSATTGFRNHVVDKLSPMSIVHLNRIRHFEVAMSTLFVQFGRCRDTTFFTDTNEPNRSSVLSDQTWFQSLGTWMENKVPKSGFCVKLNEQNDWAASRHDPAVSELKSRLERLGNVKQLDEVAEIIQARHFPTLESADNDGIPVVSGRCIAGRVADLEDAKICCPDSIPNLVFLQKDDLLVPHIWGSSSSVAMFRDDREAVAHQSVLVIRPNQELVSPEYLREYLNSTSATMLIESTASTMAGHMRTSRRDLAQIPVPIDQSFSEEFRQIESAIDELDEMRNELNQQKTSLFEAKDKADFRNRVANIKHLAKLVTLSINSVRDANFQISNYYPYPIAYGYRLLDGITIPAELYKQQLRVSENILAFLGGISLALIHKDDRAESKVDVVDYWEGGISPGHWRDLIGKSSKVFASYDNSPLATEIQRLEITKGKSRFGKIVEFIITSKNDYKHDRGPSVEADFIEASKQMSEKLAQCLSHLSFFTDYPIRKIYKTNPSRSGNSVKIESLLVRGDHPGMPQERIEVPLTMETSRLREGDYYISTGYEDWVPLFPFFVSKVCRHCKVNEIHFPDRWFRSKNIVELKSFERGHTVQDRDASESLDTWVLKSEDSAI